MFWRKLGLNLLIILVCATIAISIPVIVHAQQKSSQAATDPHAERLVLVGEFIGDLAQNITDNPFLWRLHLKRDGTVVKTWDEIYTDIINGAAITYDRDHLELTPYGLCYRGAYQSGYKITVTYRGLHCTIKLP